MAKLIYSSHNLEAELKRDILIAAGERPESVARVHQEVLALEKKAALESDAVFCVSAVG